MRNVVAIALLVVFAWGCQPAELTPEKKQKVESLQNEIAKIAGFPTFSAYKQSFMTSESNETI